MDFRQILLNTLSHDPNVRNEAAKELSIQEQQNFPNFLGCLATELANDSGSEVTRQSAGLQLKNALYAKSSSLKAKKAERWLAIDAGVRDQIKNLILKALSSPLDNVRTSAAQAVAEIALSELPKGQWPVVIEGLCNNVLKGENLHAKHSSLKALGFICSEINPDLVKHQNNLILGAVVFGMNKDQGQEDIMLAATHALSDILDFCKANFEDQKERSVIMKVILELTQVPSEDIKEAAYQCLVIVGETYYDILQEYIKDILTITIGSMQNQEDSVAKQAIQFWDVIAKEEGYRLDDEIECWNCIRGVLGMLLPALMLALKRQDEFEEVNVATVAADCIMNIAFVVTDDIIPPVIKFVEANISLPDWQSREAALACFGSVLAGPKTDVISQLITTFLPHLSQHTLDKEEQIRITAVWVIGRICEVHPHFIPNHLNAFMELFKNALNDTPAVACQGCYGLIQVAAAFDPGAGKRVQNNPLQHYFAGLIELVLNIAGRPQADHKLIRACFELITQWITSASITCLPLVEELLPVVVQKLEELTFAQAQNSEAMLHINQLQGSLCGIIQTIAYKIEGAVATYADKIMQLLHQVYHCQHTAVHQEVLMATGAMAQALEKNFLKYMEVFYKLLTQALQQIDEYSVCNDAVGLAADIARGLGHDFVPYCDEIMNILLQDLQNEHLFRDVKPNILICFGDIALNIEHNFVRYLQVVMNVLGHAAQTRVDPDDYDQVDYLVNLRIGILQAYSTIISGLNCSKGLEDTFLPYANQVIQTIVTIWADGDNRDDAIATNCLTVIGDLAHFLKGRVSAQLKSQEIQSILAIGSSSPNPKIKDTASWSLAVLQTHLGP